MSRILIFEGPERTGKTQIADTVASLLGMKVHKSSLEIEAFQGEDRDTDVSPQVLSTFTSADVLFSTFAGNGRIPGIVLDRFHLSELVYSRVFGRVSREDLLWKADSLLNEADARLIYCWKDEYEDFDDEHVSKEENEKIREEYENVLGSTSIPTLKMETSDKDLAFQVETVLHFV